jgi:hypothetical protein
MPKSLRVGPYYGPIAGLSAAPNRVFIERETIIDKALTYGSFASSMPRWLGRDNITNAAPWGSGIGLAAAVPCQEGDTFSQISFITGSTGATTPTAGYVAIYDTQATPALMEQSADFGTTAFAASTLFTQNLRNPVRIPITGTYYVSISFTAATPPSLTGINVLAGAVANGLSFQPRLCAVHGSALGGVAPLTLVASNTAKMALFMLT